MSHEQYIEMSERILKLENLLRCGAQLMDCIHVIEGLNQQEMEWLELAKAEFPNDWPANHADKGQG